MMLKGGGFFVLAVGIVYGHGGHDVEEDYLHSSWESVSALPIALSDMSATKVDEYKAIVVGGCSSAQLSCDSYDGCTYCPSSSDRTFAYDAIENVWEELATSPRERYRHAAAYFDNKLYVGGGRSIEDDSVLNLVDVYDVIGNSWSSFDASIISVPRSDLAAIAFNDYLFFVGGYNANYTAQSSAIGIQLSTRTTASLPSLNKARGDFGIVHYDQSAYAIGGWSHEDWCNPLDDVEMIRLESDLSNDAEWQIAPSLAIPRGDKGAAVVLGKVYVAGGEHNNNCNTGSQPVHDVELLHDDQWESIANIPEAKFRTAAVGLGPYLFVFGGQAERQEAENCPDASEFCYPITDHVYRLTLIQTENYDHDHDCDHNHKRPLSRIALFFLGLAAGLLLGLIFVLVFQSCRRCRKPFDKSTSHEAVTMLHIKGLTNSQFEHDAAEDDADESKGVELGEV